MLRRITKVLGDMHRSKTDIAGILYLHPINDARMTGSAKKNLELFPKVVGSNNMSQCVMVTTKWSKENPTMAQEHEQELLSSFWKPMFDAGVKYARYMDDRKSGLDILRPLCGEASIVPEVIYEWAYEGKSLHQTKAGRAVEDEVSRAKEVAENDIREVRQEAAEAIKKKDYEGAKALENERKQLEARLRKMEEEREKLQIEFEEKRKKQQKEWETVQEQRQREYQAEQEKTRADHARYIVERDRKQRLQSSQTGRVLRRIGLGAMGTAAIVFTGGLAAPLVAAAAVAHEVKCDDEKEKEK
jgi:hypothetical protein